MGGLLPDLLLKVRQRRVEVTVTDGALGDFER
jgi:hypothetical protein